MKRLIGWLAFLIIAPARADIIQVSTLWGAMGWAQRNEMILLDQDNTVFEPVQTLGSDQWARAYVRELEAKGVPYELAEKMKTRTWMAIQQVTRVQPVEPSTRLYIAAALKNVRIFGLTARPAEAAELTERQLRSLDINYSRVQSEDEVALLNEGTLYRRGVVYTSDGPKGAALLKFLDHYQLKPQSIALIDDRLENLRDVEAALAKRGIRFMGIHYTAAQPKIDAYRSEIANYQLNMFNSSRRGSILSDEEALRAMARRQRDCQWVLWSDDPFALRH